MKLKPLCVILMTMLGSVGAQAQSELYPKHFDLEQVELLDGPMKTAMSCGSP